MITNKFVPETRLSAVGVSIAGNSYKVIAVIGWANDWAAYLGLLDSSDDCVANNGDKVSQYDAEKLFPNLVKAGLHYRP